MAAGDKDDEGSVIVEVGPKGAKVSLPTRVAQFIAPDRWARIQLEDAIVASIIAKKKEGTPLSPEEAAFDAGLYDRSAKRYLRELKVRQLAAVVYPEVEERMKALPPPKEARTKGTFWERLKEDAGTVTDDDEMREIYARIMAGEAARPGTFSNATLSALRNIDKRTAEAFSRIVRFAVFAKAIPFHTGDRRSEFFYNDRSFTHEDRLRLEEAGLVSSIPTSMKADPIDIKGRSVGQIIAGDVLVVVEQPDLLFGVLMLTNAGQELFQVVHTSSSPAVAKILGLLHPKSNVQWTRLTKQERVVTESGPVLQSWFEESELRPAADAPDEWPAV